jgi:hypothetical protein
VAVGHADHGTEPNPWGHVAIPDELADDERCAACGSNGGAEHGRGNCDGGRGQLHRADLERGATVTTTAAANETVGTYEFSISCPSYGNCVAAVLARLHRINGRLTLTPTGAKAPTLTRTLTFKSKRAG